jgi:nicotinamide-nucleotide amidase
MSQLTEILTQKSLTIAVAESCTGGNLSALLTSESGASDYFDRGFVTYSNQAKMDMLGVSADTLKTHGAVSEQTALEMVQGVMQNSNADIGVSITGVAGPTGGTKDKPVGTVCFGFCIDVEYTIITQHFIGNREQITQSSVEFSIGVIVQQLINKLLK